MRHSVIVLSFAASLFFSPAVLAQSGPGCGSANIKFDVKTEKAQQKAPAPEEGKALVFFLQDDLDFNSRPRPTTRFGIDGTWVGATHSNSYFYVSVDPGEHHLCANWQSYVGLMPKRSTAAAHFTAEAGKTYFFRARDIAKTGNTGGDNGTEYVKEADVMLEPVDSDEAQVLIGSFSFSLSHPKK